MRYIRCSYLIFLASFVLTQAEAQPITTEKDEGDRRGSVAKQEGSYDEELARARYETALARERAQQAYFNHQAELYEGQRVQQDIYTKRAEQERRYQERSDGITNVNQVANTVATVVRQFQVLSGGRGGW